MIPSAAQRIVTPRIRWRAASTRWIEPPELGPVRVHLTATEHSDAARLVVQDDTVRQLIESQADTLRRSLHEAGISLTRLDVNQDGAVPTNIGSKGARTTLFQPPYNSGRWVMKPRQDRIRTSDSTARVSGGRSNDHRHGRGAAGVVEYRSLEWRLNLFRS